MIRNYRIPLILCTDNDLTGYAINQSPVINNDSYSISGKIGLGSIDIPGAFAGFKVQLLNEMKYLVQLQDLTARLS